MGKYRIVHCAPWWQAPQESVVDLLRRGDGVVEVTDGGHDRRRWLAESELVLMVRADRNESVRPARVLRPEVDCVRWPSVGDKVETSKWGVATIAEVHDGGAAITARNPLGVELLIGRTGGWWLYAEPKTPAKRRRA